MHEYVQIKYSIFKHFSLMPFIYLLIPTQILTFYFVLKTLIWLFSKQIFPPSFICCLRFAKGSRGSNMNDLSPLHVAWTQPNVLPLLMKSFQRNGKTKQIIVQNPKPKSFQNVQGHTLCHNLRVSSGDWITFTKYRWWSHV